MKSDQRLEMRVSQEFLDEVDSKRGVVPRATFVKAVLKRAIAGLPVMPREEEVRASDVVPSAAAIEHVLERPWPEPSKQERIETGRQVLSRAQPKPFTPPRPKGGK